MPKQAHTKVKVRHVPYVRGFKRPNDKAKIDAITTTHESLVDLHKAFDPKEHFESIPRCESIDDWLAQYKEIGQSYTEFLHSCPWLSTRKRKAMKMECITGGRTLCEKYPNGKVYVVPLGDFTSSSGQDVCIPDIKAITEYCRIFLSLPVVQLPTISVEAKNGKMYWGEEKIVGRQGPKLVQTAVESRYNKDTNRYQLNVINVLSKLRKCLPDDAICLLALTMYDLYEDATDLFVAGMAAGNHRVAVFSLLRYDPNLTFSGEFWHQIVKTNQHGNKKRKQMILQRSCKLVVHEICHLLGVDHCIFYMCCMNGSGHLQEDFRQPMYLCPVDLRKLHTLCGFDVIERYKQLQAFFAKYHMPKDEAWVKKRLLHIES